MGEDITLAHLRAILDAIHSANRFTEGMSFEQFAGNVETVLATTQALRIAGGTMKPIPDSVRSRHPSVPWLDTIDLSDWLISRYYEVTPNIVWRKVKQDLPAIEPHIAHAIEEETRRESTNG